MSKQASLLLLVVTGCANTGISNSDMVALYDNGRYDDIVAVEPSGDLHRDSALSVRAIEATEAALIASAKPIVERCLEDEMDRLDTYDLTGSFSFEVQVEPNGDITRADVLDHDVGERDADRKLTRHAAHFAPCVGDELLTLSLDPVLEETYVHTYVGYVGEAW